MREKKRVGLWIDHREAVIVVLSSDGEKTLRIHSDVEKQLRRSEGASAGPFEAQQVPADDSRERAFNGHLVRYYDTIVSHLRDVESIFIFGPGEAKGELEKRFERDKTVTREIFIETSDKMSAPEIQAKVRHHFHQEAREGVDAMKTRSGKN